MQILDAREVFTCRSGCDLKAQSVRSLWDMRNSVAVTCADVLLYKFWCFWVQTGQQIVTYSRNGRSRAGVVI